MQNRPVLKSVVNTGYILAVVATIIWSGNYIVAQGLSDLIPPVGLAFWRWVIAVVVLTPFAIRSLIEQWEVTMQNIIYLSVAALLGVTVFNTLVYIAGHTTNAINLSLIAASSPIFIILMERFFCREPITPTKAMGVLVALSGVFIIITDGSLLKVLEMNIAVGDIWMLLASITFAGYSVLVKRKPVEMHMRTFLLSTMLLGVLFLFPFYLWEHFFSHPVVFNPSIILAVLYVGILASLVAYFAWNKAIIIIGPSRAAVVYYLIPVFSSIVATLFLDEAIRFTHIISMGLIILGICITNRRQTQKDSS